MFTSCKEPEQVQHWSKERHLILLIFCFIRDILCWARGDIFCVVEHGKCFSKRSAPGYMLNDDLLKLFRIRTIARISHFVCLGNQLYHTHDLKCAEVFIFLQGVIFFQDLYIFLHHMLLLEMFILLTENILTSLSSFLLEEVMWQNNSHYVFLMLGDMAVDFNYKSSLFFFPHTITKILD